MFEAAIFKDWALEGEQRGLQQSQKDHAGMREAQHRLNLPEYFRRCECRNNVIKPTLPPADGRGDVKNSSVKQTIQAGWEGLSSGPEGSKRG